MQHHFHLDKIGFLRDLDGKRLIWLPAHLRGDQVVCCGGVIITGGGTGAVTFLHDLYSELDYI